MRVTLCVDALQPELSGIGRYTWELWNGLGKRTEVSRLYASHGNMLIDEPVRLLSDSRYRPGSRWLRWLQRRKARKIFRSTLIHSPNYFLPTNACTGVITVHDLSVFRYPETHPASRVKSFERQFASSLDRAVQVITDTETVRHELIETFSLAPEIVSTVHLGVDRRFRPLAPEEANAAFKRWGLAPGGYGLSVAAFEPRKKIGELIKAWARLPAAIRSRYPLVLAGSVGWENAALHEQIKRAERQGWLKHLGFVDDQLLPQLYAGARLFVYPSIYEGFGLPPIEAMASGTPVIVSDRSCLGEVCGDAARFINPDDLDCFTAVVNESLVDESWRAKMIGRGLRRAQMYTWESCIAATVAVYRKALAVLG